MSYLAKLKRMQHSEPITTQDYAEDREATRRVAADSTSRLSAQNIIDIDAGKISAVLIDCDFGPLWFVFDDGFQSRDGYPVFFASELPYLRKMTPDQLRRRYAEKRSLCGGWIRDRIEH